jgi:predicted phage tail protein
MIFGKGPVFGVHKLAQVGMLSKALAGVGGALLLSGVSEMLFPLPKFDDFDSEGDPRLSFSFNGIQQTNRAGTPVPMVYGEIFTGSVVISASVDTEQVQA